MKKTSMALILIGLFITNLTEAAFLNGARRITRFIQQTRTHKMLAAASVVAGTVAATTSKELVAIPVDQKFSPISIRVPRNVEVVYSSPHGETALFPAQILQKNEPLGKKDYQRYLTVAGYTFGGNPSAENIISGQILKSPHGNGVIPGNYHWRAEPFQQSWWNWVKNGFKTIAVRPSIHTVSTRAEVFLPLSSRPFPRCTFQKNSTGSLLKATCGEYVTTITSENGESLKKAELYGSRGNGAVYDTITLDLTDASTRPENMNNDKAKISEKGA